MVFGVQQAVLFFLGYSVYSWYPKFVNDNFVNRITGSVQYDLEWAKGTQEIMAWSNTSYMMLIVNGVSWAVWLANYLVDNEGGDIH